MTPEQFDDFLESTERAAEVTDRRLERVAESNWRNVDAFLNGTLSTFAGFAGVLQRIPFPRYFAGNNGSTSNETR